ncbi:hypothetical protein [Lactovum odontotermitis]
MINRNFRLILFFLCLFLFYLFYQQLGQSPFLLKKPLILELSQKIMVFVCKMSPFLWLSGQGLQLERRVSQIVRYQSRLSYWLRSLILLDCKFLIMIVLIGLSQSQCFFELLFASFFLVHFMLLIECFFKIELALVCLAVLLNLGLYLPLGFLNMLSLNLRQANIPVLVCLAVASFIITLLLLKRKDILV